MQDDVNWKLSLLLDDELEPAEAIDLLEKIYQDSQLLSKWYGYQTIRQVLKAGGGIQPQPEFLERVKMALAEEAILVPSDSRSGRWTESLKKFNFGRWTMPVAMAAVVALLVVLVSKQVFFNSPNSGLQIAVAKKPSGSSGGTGRQATDYSRLEDYYFLVHSEDSLYLTGPQHVLGYARIVSHGR